MFDNYGPKHFALISLHSLLNRLPSSNRPLSPSSHCSKLQANDANAAAPAPHLADGGNDDGDDDDNEQSSRAVRIQEL